MSARIKECSNLNLLMSVFRLNGSRLRVLREFTLAANGRNGPSSPAGIL